LQIGANEDEKMKVRHLYGPVPSRRLGLSLGVDVVPYKVCSYDCVYCQLGRTTKLTATPGPWVKHDEVMSELERWLAEGNAADYITFSGSGEPTLNSNLGEMVERAVRLSDIPVAVITNGSLLSNPDVMEAVSGADVLLPSLDAGTEETFRAINRPCDGLVFERMVEGLIRAGQEFHGSMWLEVMLVRGLNDSEAELAALREIIDRIQPDKVQINTVERPSRSGDVAAASENTLVRACEMLGPASEIIVPRPVAARAERDGASEELLLDLLGRRPCTLRDITAGTGLHMNQAVKILAELMAGGLVETAGEAADPHYRVTDSGETYQCTAKS